MCVCAFSDLTVIQCPQLLCCIMVHALMRLMLWLNASQVFVWCSSCLTKLLLGGHKYLVIPNFGCSPTLCPGMMLLDCALLRLLYGASPGLVCSICFSPFLSLSGSQTWIWLWYCLNARRNLAKTCHWDFIPAAGVYMCRDQQCLVVLVRKE